MTSTMATDVSAAQSGFVGTDATSILDQVLSDYGLTSLSTWAWGQVTAGASSAQVLLNMYQTPEFKARFPAIPARQAAGLPPISPSDYVNYEDSLAQMNNTYGLPPGYLTSPDVVTAFLSGDTSVSEVQARVQQGFQDVASAPPAVRQFYTQTFGIGGDAALAAHFTDPKIALPLLEQQATAATLGGQAALGGIAMSGADAMKLAQLGDTASSVSSGLNQLQQTQGLYDPSVTEQPLDEGTTGVEAQFGLSSTATQAVIARQQSREADFRGGGAPQMDQYGAHGAGTAKPV